MDAETRRFASRLAAAAGGVLLVVSWPFWMAGTGPALLWAGLSCLVAAILLDRSWGSLAMVAAAAVLGVLSLVALTAPARW